jgi:hypothetical protein
MISRLHLSWELGNLQGAIADYSGQVEGFAAFLDMTAGGA